VKKNSGKGCFKIDRKGMSTVESEVGRRNDLGGTDGIDIFYGTVYSSSSPNQPNVSNVFCVSIHSNPPMPDVTGHCSNPGWPTCCERQLTP
jgi:hypothetical protein